MQSVHEGIHFNCDKRVKEEISLVINEITRQQKGITVKYIYAITSSRKTFFCNHCDYKSMIFPSWNNFLHPEWLSLTIDLWTHLLQIKCLPRWSDCIYILYSCPYLLSCNFTDHKNNVLLHATTSYVHYDNCQMLTCNHIYHK